MASCSRILVRVANSDEPKLLDQEDLIDDREVSSSEGDQLNHEAIAAQLDEIAATVPTPSNIALYGPWGSGKSGIGNLLKTHVRVRPGFKFARFDAFKYVETPLLRSFLSAIATELGIKDDAFHKDLYTAKTSTELGLPASKWLKIVVIFVAVVLSLTALLIATVAVISAFMPGDFETSFKDLAKAVVAAGVVPAALLAGLITMANKSLQVDRSSGKPESDEQFEELFRALVQKSKARRLVIFVDELDRCSADEVVVTLDAIRTFLGVHGCVFVIAADQRVLEEALNKKARQETPYDEVNPYYSTGSAYLDKVFQYQVALPALRPQSITRFAAELVRNRGGVWAEVRTDYVVSILIPAHVSSPRRVKHLLNAFAISFRLASTRHSAGVLSENPVESAAALARLVCLRVEFPTFAHELTTEARLPDMVLDLTADKNATWPFPVSEEVRATAMRYVDGEAPAQIIAEDGDGELAERTESQSNRQLINYLRRTRSVRGPSRDLIFLQSSGSDFGISGDTARTLELAASNADTSGALQLFADLAEADKAGATRLLEHRARTLLGVEATNAVRTLMAILETNPELCTSGLADSASETIDLLIDQGELLDDQTTPAAWNIASRGESDAALALQQTVLRSLDENPALVADAAFLLTSASQALRADRSRFNSIAAHNLSSESATRFIDGLGELEEEEAMAVLVAAEDAAAGALAEAVRLRTASPENVDAPVEDEAAAEEVLFDPEVVFVQLEQLARKSITGRLSDVIVRLFLAVDEKDARQHVQNLLADDAIASVRDSMTIDAVLGDKGVRRRQLAGMTPWLRGVEPDAIEPRHVGVLRGASIGVWNSALANDQALAAASEVMSALTALVERLPSEHRLDLREIGVKAFQAWAKDEETAALQSRTLKLVSLFGDSGLMSVHDPLLEAFRRLQDVYAESIPMTGDRSSEIGKLLLTNTLVAIEESADDPAAAAILESVIAEMSSSTVLADPLLTEAMLAYVSSAGADAAQLALPIDGTKVSELLAAHGAAALGMVALWFQVAHPDRSSASAVVDRLRQDALLNEDMRLAIATARSSWTHEEQEGFLEQLLLENVAVVPDDVDLTVYGYWTVGSDTAARVLVERFAQCTNNTERAKVIELWRKLPIVDEHAATLLIEGVAIPALNLNNSGQNRQAADLGLSALELATSIPRDLRPEVGQAVESAAHNERDFETRAASILGGRGFRTERFGFLGRWSRPGYEGD
jgi:hypothetical protein